MVALFKLHILNLSPLIFEKMSICVGTKPRTSATLLLENWGRRESIRIVECEPLGLLFPPRLHNFCSLLNFTWVTFSDMGIN